MSQAEAITRAYGGDWHGNYGLIPTPGHSPKDRGTTVRDADDGDVIFASFNGGDWRELKDECRRLGLLPDRARDSDQSGPRRHMYHDAQGQVIRAKVNPGPRGEKYGWQHPVGDGWKWGKGKAPDVPYRLLDLLASSGLVVMAEGEKHADKLAGWGFTATSLKDWRADFAPYIAGRPIVILPDNDATGVDLAAKAKAHAERAGCSVQIVDLPGLPSGGDIMDWAGTAAQLRELIDANEATAERDDLLPLADLAAWAASRPKPTAFVWKGGIPKGEVTRWDGAGGTAKSTGAQQLATCRAAGLPFLGVDLEPGISLYHTAEDSFDRLEWVHYHIWRAIGVPGESLVGKLHLSSVRGLLNNELATFDQDGRIRPTAAFARLRATIAETGADLVVLDNVAHLFAGNENDRGQVTAFYNLLYSLGVTVLLIGHPNKAGDTYSGSTASLNAIRSQLVTERPDELDPDLLSLKVGKANYARPGETITYRWHDFALWLEADLPPDTRAELAETVRATGDNELFLRCLRLRNDQQRPVSESPSSRTYAPRVFAEMAESKKIGAARLEAAMERLFRVDRIERGFVGRIDRKDKEGLREKCAEVRADLAPTPCADVRQEGAPSALSHTLGTTYQPGAAHEAAAPDGMILAPGETGDEPVEGFR